MSSPSFEFIAKNLHLFGFDSPSSALLQTVRELVENSVDACCRKVYGKPSVNSAAAEGGGIEIAVHVTVQKEMVLLEVSDNGIGLVDIGNTFQPFATDSISHAHPGTNVNANGDRRIGKYGVGLSASLLYSFLHTQKHTKVVSKATHDTHINCMFVGMQIEQGGNVRILNRSTNLEPQGVHIEGVSTHACTPILHTQPTYTGTSICIPLPVACKENMDATLQSVEHYLLSICMHPQLSIRTDFRLTYNDSVTSTQYISLGRRHLLNPAPIQSRLRELLQAHPYHPVHAKDVIDATYGEGNATDTNAHSISTLCILSSYPPSSPSPTSTVPYNLGPEEVLLRVYRHANGKPLYEHNRLGVQTISTCKESMKACALTRGVKKYGWGKNNIQFTRIDSSEDDEVNYDAYDGVMMGVLKSITGDVAEGAKEGGRGVVADLYIFYDSDAVAYGDLKKSCIQSLGALEQKMISQALDGAMSYLTNSPACAHALISPQQLLKSQVRILSSAVARICSFTKDDEIDSLLCMLGAGSSMDTEDGHGEGMGVEDAIYHAIEKIML